MNISPTRDRIEEKIEEHRDEADSYDPYDYNEERHDDRADSDDLIINDMFDSLIVDNDK